MKKSFILYSDICKVVEELTDEQAGILFKKIINYEEIKTHENPSKPIGLSGLLSAVFHPFKCHLDRDFEAWKKQYEANVKNGKKGGRPKKNKGKKNPSKGVNVNVNDNVNVNVIPPKSPKGDSQVSQEKVKEIIDYLNEVTGKNYRPNTTKTKRLINARFKEGFDVANFKDVINKKTSAWARDPNMEIYLRPDTLFSTKFEGYLNEIKTKEYIDDAEYL